MKYKIAYIDEDKGWINTFYHTFKNDFEIERVLIDSSSSVDSILGNLFSIGINAVVTDYLLKENADVSFNGNKIVEELKLLRPHFPVVMLTSFTSQAINHSNDVHIIYSKDILTIEDEKDEEELDVLRKKISSNISNYYKKIENTNNDIEKLIEKRINEGLSVSEEEKLTKLFILFDELNPEGKELPANLVDRNSISKLNEFVNETKEVLKQLKKLNPKK
jgi:hypothetical protein